MQSYDNASMYNRRQYERSPAIIKVDLFHDSLGILSGTTDNISDGGLFVRLHSHANPPIGTVVQVSMKRATAKINDTPIKMMVVHHRDKGLGLKFV